MRTVVVIQARMGSTRLPGKVLAGIAGRPMIAHVLERARLIAGTDEVVVAVPDLPEDDQLAAAVSALDARAIRGSAEDVLNRYITAMDATGATTVVRVTADCPLLSPRVASSVVAAHADGEVDYASNTLGRTYPRGLDTEAVAGSALRAAQRESTSPGEREHVTPFIWHRPERFRLRSVRADVDRSQLRWTVDEPADLAFVRAVHEELGPRPFEIEDVLALLKQRPGLAALNATVTQKVVE
ncbi:MAG: cytidylyltransferase domain-containing protein [Candidatus Limnocylindria bacterium]